MKRGEFEAIHKVKEIKNYSNFLKEIDKVGSFVNY
jgi:hypothetical protein